MSQAQPAADAARILVADDEPSIALLFQEILSSRKPDGPSDEDLRDLSNRLFGIQQPKPTMPLFEVATCSQGELAVELVRQSLIEQRPFRVAFLDARMPPGQGGIAAAKAIRDLDQDIQIIITTAYSDFDPSDLAERIPPADKVLYQQKPFHPMEIRQFAISLSAKWEAERGFRALRQRLELLVEERTGELHVALARLREEMEERERVNALILAAKRQWESTFDSLSDGVVIVDTEGRIQRLNMSLSKRLGSHPRNQTGTMVSQLSENPELFGELTDAMSILTNGRQHNREISVPGLGGDFLVTASPLEDEDSSERTTILVFHDITERKRLEQQLRQSQKMEAIGTLAGGIAHDFNNILGIIMGFTELCQAEAADESPMKRRLTSVLDASSRARDLVAQILTFSRRDQEERAPLHLTPLVRETIKLLSATMPKTVTIREEICLRGGDIIEASPARIQQIVLNLCSNASHAMREQGGTMTIGLMRLEAPRVAELKPELGSRAYFKLWVADTGVGIDHTIRERIFDPFFTTKKIGEGTGMGLSVVHGIVDQLGGIIEVESEPGAGSCFSVWLPAAHQSQAQTPLSGESATCGVGRVLFVDDEEALTQIGQEMLEGLGYAVTAVSSPQDALSRLQTDPQGFDVLITDLNMPGLSGLKLAAAARELGATLPIIIYTGSGSGVDEAKAQALGVVATMQKPLSRAQLAKAVAGVLGG